MLIQSIRHLFREQGMKAGGWAWMKRLVLHAQLHLDRVFLLPGISGRFFFFMIIFLLAIDPVCLWPLEKAAVGDNSFYCGRCVFFCGYVNYAFSIPCCENLLKTYQGL